MKYIYFIILILLITVGCDLIPEEKYYYAASELEEKEKYLEAISYHNKALQKNPNFRPSLLNRGADKSALGYHKGAIDDYKKIISFDSDNALALTNIANNYEKLNDYKNSIKFYTIALQKGNIINESKFDIHLSSNEFDDDSQYLVNETEILYQRGLVFLLDYQFEKSLIDLRQCINLGYNIADSYFYIGEIYKAKNDKTKACENYKKSADLGIIDAKESIKTYCGE